MKLENISSYILKSEQPKNTYRAVLYITLYIASDRNIYGLIYYLFHTKAMNVCNKITNYKSFIHLEFVAYLSIL